ncbi:MAG: ATP-binding protein [Acidimicrobiia bacterium]|nr:ATP-binding protein [Acidimicrobiia bacterium]
MPNRNALRLDFRSDLDLIDTVQTVGDQVGRLAGLDDDARHWVGLAVRESVVNAILHGNCGDVEKRVVVEFSYLQEDAATGLAISVRDEGCGFDPDSLPDPLAPENLLKPSGRGIFLIRSFMDEMVLRRVPGGGSELHMVKRVQLTRS